MMAKRSWMDRDMGRHLSGDANSASTSDFITAVQVVLVVAAFILAALLPVYALSAASL